jgi:RNA ligase (TIGR02306 family)
VANTLWKKIKKFFGRLPTHEFCFGSRNVQLQGKLSYKGFYDQNVYGKIAKQYGLEKILKPGEALYGEIVGDGIQKGYTYGCGPGEHKFVAYDVMVDGRWLNSDEFMNWCLARGIEKVPLLHFGPYDKAIMDQLRQGDSVYAPSQKVREGIVIKPIQEAMAYCGRKVLKYINDEYLLKDQTDFH